MWNTRQEVLTWQFEGGTILQYEQEIMSGGVQPYNTGIGKFEGHTDQMRAQEVAPNSGRLGG